MWVKSTYWRLCVGQKHYAMPCFLSLGIFHNQRLITEEVFKEACRTTSFDEYKVQNTSIIISKELLGKKCGIKVSVQAAIIVIVTYPNSLSEETTHDIY